MNMTIWMKLFLLLSFLALSDAWLWSRRFIPIKRGNPAGKGPEQGSPAGPLKSILGEIDELRQDIAALTGRVDELESNFEGLVSAIEEQEDGSENPEPIAHVSAFGTSKVEPEHSEETVVSALRQRLESRLNEKKSEQKQKLSRVTPTN